jgi:hypothetical protein
MLFLEVISIFLFVGFVTASVSFIARTFLNPEKTALTDLPSVKFYFEWGAPYCVKQLWIYLPFIAALWTIYYFAHSKAAWLIPLVAIVSSLASAFKSSNDVKNLFNREQSFEPSYFAIGVVIAICLAILWRFIDNYFVVQTVEDRRLKMGWAVIAFYPAIFGVSMSALYHKITHKK